VDRPTPKGDCAALGAQVIARSECGNYGEDSLIGWKFPDGTVVIERVGANRGSMRCAIAATDNLQVSAGAWGDLSMASAETLLKLITVEGEELELSHFEFSAAWGGPTDDAVAKLARTIATEAGCTVTVIPMTFPAS